ncbi:alcohol dehydrogenase catalytic domain-containing protein [Nonomuraea sp. 10N515B]|uniref:alcohol dehydrogenase catalytic domain-containing protein n=1 Tax=Nonomuraea sp. 10N515B TaxID=3457422 RepID=UPI003FCCA11A
MRAVTLTSVPETPAVADVPTPQPEAGEVLVKVAVSSINGFDAATAAGYLQGAMEHRFPLVVGKDFAGTVEALGDGVEGFTVGQAVFGVVMKPFLGTGSLAEYVTVSADYGITPIPEGLGVQEAGVLGLAGTAALDSLNAVAPADGETVLISGATGGVGALACSWPPPAAPASSPPPAPARRPTSSPVSPTPRFTSWTSAAICRLRYAQSPRKG